MKDIIEYEAEEQTNQQQSNDEEYDRVPNINLGSERMRINGFKGPLRYWWNWRLHQEINFTTRYVYKYQRFKHKMTKYEQKRIGFKNVEVWLKTNSTTTKATNTQGN